MTEEKNRTENKPVKLRVMLALDLTCAHVELWSAATMDQSDRPAGLRGGWGSCVLCGTWRTCKLVRKHRWDLGMGAVVEDFRGWFAGLACYGGPELRSLRDPPDEWMVERLKGVDDAIILRAIEAWRNPRGAPATSRGRVEKKSDALLKLLGGMGIIARPKSLTVLWSQHGKPPWRTSHAFQVKGAASDKG